MTMDARKQRILEAIVAIYSTGGEPVGSGLLASHFDMALSSATLRNEMAALTKLGLLEQPHTSAGRVPSPKGYRYYLDHLLEAPAAIALSAADRENIDRLFADMDVEPEKLAQSAARALADYTGCAAVATTPQAEDLCIAHFEVVQVGRYSAAVLAVTSSGGVRTRVARIHTGLTREDADEMARLLNSSLTFVAPEDLTPSLQAWCFPPGAGWRRWCSPPKRWFAPARSFTWRACSTWPRCRMCAQTLARCWKFFLTTKRPAP